MVQVAKGRFRAVTGTNGKSRQRARESFPMERYSEKVRPGSGDPGAMMAVGRGSARCRGDRDARPIPLPFPDSSTGQCPCQGSEARGRLPPRSALSLNAEFERRTANAERSGRVLIQKSISCTARSHSLFSNAGRNPPSQNPQSFSCNETEPPLPQPAAIRAAKKRITMTQKKRAWVPIWCVVGAIFSF